MRSKAAAATVIFTAVISLQAANPSNPNATGAAKALYQYLQDISGKQILSGQESMYGDGAPSTRDKYIFQRVNKYPAIYTSDFGDVGKTNLADRAKVVSNCKKYHDSGAIIAVQYHMIQPDLADGSGFSAMNIKGSGYTKISDILTEGSTLNTEFKKRLDEIAGYFSTMEKQGIAILWRPFHEMNGDFFWWSYQDKFKDLWIYTWKYLTETKKCNNLLWVFGTNFYSDGATGKAGPSFYYPGHEYVDVLSVDVYTEYSHSYGQHLHDDLLALGGGKPIAIAENGKMPDIPAMKASQPKWTYWCTWWGFEISAKGNTDELYSKNYGDPSVITRDEVPDIVSVKHAKSGVKSNTRAGNGIHIVHRTNSVSITALTGCDRIILYSINGKCAATIRGNQGIIPSRKLRSGTYIVQIIRGNNRTAEQLALQ